MSKFEASDPEVRAKLERWVDLIGPENVITEKKHIEEYVGRNIGEYAKRTVLAILKPKSRDQLPDIISVSISGATRVGLFPVSRGKNWGLGSALPVEPDCVLLDLSGLRSIVDIDYETGLAFIEAGVSQGELAKAIKGSPFMLNVTASSSETSVIGNALERGVGFHRQRDSDLIGIEVALSSGEITRLGGYWPLTEDIRSAFRYKQGVGVNLASLFFQSNYGIVVAGVISLIRRPERLRVLKLKCSIENLPRALWVEKSLYQRGLLRSILRIYSPESVSAYGLQRDGSALFCAYGSVEGCNEIVDTTSKMILTSTLNAGCFESVTFIDGLGESNSSVFERAVVNCFHGDPEVNNEMINQSFGVENCLLDQRSRVGWISFLLIVPFTPQVIEQVFAAVSAITQESNMLAHSTMNIISTDAIDMVIAVRFKRDVLNTRRAHAVLNALYVRCAQLELYPYRLDIDHQAWLKGLYSGSYEKILARIKHSLDPYDIISPGRYS